MAADMGLWLIRRRMRATANGTEIYLQFLAGASRIVRTYNRVVSGAPWVYVEPAGVAVPLTGPWALRFVSGGPMLT